MLPYNEDYDSDYYILDLLLPLLLPLYEVPWHSDNTVLNALTTSFATTTHAKHALTIRKHTRTQAEKPASPAKERYFP